MNLFRCDPRARELLAHLLFDGMVDNRPVRAVRERFPESLPVVRGRTTPERCGLPLFCGDTRRTATGTIAARPFSIPALHHSLRGTVELLVVEAAPPWRPTHP